MLSRCYLIAKHWTEDRTADSVIVTFISEPHSLLSHVSLPIVCPQGWLGLLELGNSLLGLSFSVMFLSQ